MNGWQRRRVLITVRTYPNPAWKGIEVSCTAGVTDDGQWIRLFPVPYRYLDKESKFRKYDWIEAEVTKHSDSRPESYRLNYDSIQMGLIYLAQPVLFEVQAADMVRGNPKLRSVVAEHHTSGFLFTHVEVDSDDAHSHLGNQQRQVQVL